MSLAFLQLLIPAITPLILAVAKKVAPKIPSGAIPIAAPIIGAAAAAIQANNPNNILVGAALGLAGVGLREIKEAVLPAKNGGWPDSDAK